jgi:hypothetical protein
MSRYILFASLLLRSAVVWGQVNGSITGTIADQTGSAVAGATVKITSEGTGAVQIESSNAEGSFTFTAVPPGLYSVSAEHPGFKKFQKQHLELTPGDHLAVGTLPLPVGDVTESVTVQAEGQALQTASSERAGIVTSEEIKDLTVINRDFTSFAELQPGVVINVSQSVQTFSGNNTFNVLGGRTTGNNITVDGLPTSNTNQSNMNTTVSLDNTQTVEVKVSNFSAEFGRNNGFAVMAVSKTGTRQLHGALYYYDRNEAFNANNFFNNRSGIAQTPLRIDYAGANLGGPLSIPHVGATKGKLFFFISAEQIGELRPKGLQTLTVPTDLERAGNFTLSGAKGTPTAYNNTPMVVIKDPTTGVAFPGNVIPASRLDGELPEATARAELYLGSRSGRFQRPIQLSFSGEPQRPEVAQQRTARLQHQRQDTVLRALQLLVRGSAGQRGFGVQHRLGLAGHSLHRDHSIRRDFADPYFLSLAGISGDDGLLAIQRIRFAAHAAGARVQGARHRGLHHSAALPQR